MYISYIYSGHISLSLYLCTYINIYIQITIHVYIISYRFCPSSTIGPCRFFTCPVVISMTCTEVLAPVGLVGTILCFAIFLLHIGFMWFQHRSLGLHFWRSQDFCLVIDVIITFFSCSKELEWDTLLVSASPSIAAQEMLEASWELCWLFQVRIGSTKRHVYHTNDIKWLYPILFPLISPMLINFTGYTMLYPPSSRSCTLASVTVHAEWHSLEASDFRDMKWLSLGRNLGSIRMVHYVLYNNNMCIYICNLYDKRTTILSYYSIYFRYI